MNANDTNIEMVNKALTAIAEGKIDAALTSFESDAKWSCAQMLPEAGVHERHDAIRSMLGHVRERNRNRSEIMNLTLYGGGDHVFAEYTRSPTNDSHAPGSEHLLA